jgi:hypothetical protein
MTIAMITFTVTALIIAIARPVSIPTRLIRYIFLISHGDGFVHVHVCNIMSIGIVIYMGGYICKWGVVVVVVRVVRVVGVSVAVVELVFVV